MKTTYEEVKEMTIAAGVTDKLTETTTEAAICPLGLFGNIPHPTICDSFYMCTGGVAIQLFCSYGFEYDPVLAVSNICSY